jgi:hypothetical protein
METKRLGKVEAAPTNQGPMTGLHALIAAAINAFDVDLQVSGCGLRQRWWIKLDFAKRPLLDAPNGSSIGIGALHMMDARHPIVRWTSVDDTLLGRDQWQDRL